jgi:CRP/FNR family transcriptional regulator, cyclic AMP receptor protein
MHSLGLIQAETGQRTQSGSCYAGKSGQEFAGNFQPRIPSGPPSPLRNPVGKGEFFRELPLEAMNDFQSHAKYFDCAARTILIEERQDPSGVLFLLSGKACISMSSAAGRRLILDIAGPGDILGLIAAISGKCSAIRAEARHPCRIASLEREDFLNFLLRYPVAGKNAARELSRHFTRACSKLKIVGLGPSVEAKLAGLLLEWCSGSRQTERGSEIRFMLTHEEVGECIGTSRETVTRSLNGLKSLGLIEQRLSTLIVPDRNALAKYAGIGSIH